MAIIDMEGRKTIGQVAYEAYCGGDDPQRFASGWERMSLGDREAWEAAGVAAMNFALETLARVIEKQPIV